jgi:hypothetical protein
LVRALDVVGAAVDRAPGPDPPPADVDEVGVWLVVLVDARFLRIAAAATSASTATPIHNFHGVFFFARSGTGRLFGSFLLACFFACLAAFFTSLARCAACDDAVDATSVPADTAVRPNCSACFPRSSAAWAASCANDVTVSVTVILLLPKGWDFWTFVPPGGRRETRGRPCHAAGTDCDHFDRRALHRPRLPASADHETCVVAAPASRSRTVVGRGARCSRCRVGLRW